MITSGTGCSHARYLNPGLSKIKKIPTVCLETWKYFIRNFFVVEVSKEMCRNIEAKTLVLLNLNLGFEQLTPRVCF